MLEFAQVLPEKAGILYRGFADYFSPYAPNENSRTLSSPTHGE
jgi:hypothetical protein